MTARQRLAAAILPALMVPALAATQEPRPAPTQGQPAAMPASEASAPRPVYVPPPRERPRRRIGGGVRGPEARWPSLYSLVPRHTALTSSATPSLFWWIDSGPPPDTRLSFYLVDDSSDQTLLQVSLQSPPARGIYRVRLADHGVKLEPGVEYEWSVALERGPGPEQILVASGWIERAPSPEGAAAPAGLEAVDFYARRGLWYDALAAASDLIDTHPEDAGPRQARAALLEQIGLAEVTGP
jgi:hypothetical protein